MPDPWLYLTAMSAAALSGALVVWLGSRLGNSGGGARANLALVAGVTTGFVVGYLVLQLRVRWPPGNGLDRLLTIVLPSAVVIEWLATMERLPRWAAWLTRLGLLAITPRILLHGSVYLSEFGNRWNPAQLTFALATCAILAAGLMGLMFWQSHRVGGALASLSLALALLAAAGTIMLAGYVTGGAAALPPAAALAGGALAARLLRPAPDFDALVSLGVVSLGGLLFIGKYFGGLSMGQILAILAAPLLSWIVELPPLRKWNPLLAGAVGLLLVAVPLLTVLTLAKRKFDRDTAPLLVDWKDVGPGEDRPGVNFGGAGVGRFGPGPQREMGHGPSLIETPNADFAATVPGVEIAFRIERIAENGRGPLQRRPHLAAIDVVQSNATASAADADFNSFVGEFEHLSLLAPPGSSPLFPPRRQIVDAQAAIAKGCGNMLCVWRDGRI